VGQVADHRQQTSHLLLTAALRNCPREPVQIRQTVFGLWLGYVQRHDLSHWLAFALGGKALGWDRATAWVGFDKPAAFSFGRLGHLYGYRCFKQPCTTGQNISVGLVLLG
jgi:hypothetical protein